MVEDCRISEGVSQPPRLQSDSGIDLYHFLHSCARFGRLYWNGQMVKEANPLELTHPQEVSAIIAVASGSCWRYRHWL